MKALTTLRRLPRRASILLFSVGMMVIAGTSAVSWLGTVNQMQTTAARDRARLYALNAAEAGIEQVVDFFNNPANYTGALPPGSDTILNASPHPLVHNVHPQPYAFFEPYLLRYSVNGSGQPVDTSGQVIVDNQGRLISGRAPIVTAWTFLTDTTDRLSSRVPTMELDLSDNDNMVFTDEEGRELARVSSIHLVNPRDFATLGDAVPVLPGNTPIICKVIATATTPRGVTMRVETLLTENRMAVVDSPAAIVSTSSANFDGQVNVYWGEVWTRGNGELINNWTGPKGLPKTTQDPWFAFRTEGQLIDSSGLYLNGLSGLTEPFTVNPIASTASNYYLPLNALSNTIQNRNRYTNRTNLYQNQTLTFPDYQYHVVKEFFVSNGLPVHFQGPNGEIYGLDRDPSSPDFGRIVQKSYAEWFHRDPTDSRYWDVEDMLVLVDTIPTDDNGQYAIGTDGIPVRNHIYRSRAPRPDGLNVSLIRNAGGSTHTRGAMFIFANIDYSGQGSPPSYSSIMGPDGQPYIVKPDGTAASGGDFPSGGNGISHNGMLYASGNVRNSGQRRFYGSILAGRGFDDPEDPDGFEGSGARSVYYNWRMRDGNWLNINQSRVRRTQWDIRRDDPSQALASLI